MPVKELTISVAGQSADSLTSLTLNANRSGGTASFFTKEDPGFAQKDPISVLGFSCIVERVSPAVSAGEVGFRTEVRISPPVTSEYIMLDKLDLQDGTSYKLSDIVSDVASAAGTTITFSGLDTEVQSFKASGRLSSVLSSLASQGCATVLVNNTSFILGDSTVSVGGFSITDEDIISLTQSKQSDFIDEVPDLIDQGVSACEEAEDIKKQIKEIEREIARAGSEIDEEADSEADPDANQDLSEGMNSLGDVSVEFGYWPPTSGWKPFDSILEVDTPPGITQSSDAWDYWVPLDNERMVNPDKPARKYYMVKDELDSSNEKTGKLMGLYNPTKVDVLYPFNPPDNSSGIYMARGNSLNIFGWPSFENIWEYIDFTIIQSKMKLEDGTETTVNKFYFVLDLTFPASITGGYDPDVHQVGWYLEAKVKYLPKLMRGWKWAGFISYQLWVIKRSGEALVYGWNRTADIIIGAIDILGNVYGLDGQIVNNVDSVADIPGGGIVAGHALVDAKGNIAGEYKQGSFYSLSGEYIGMTFLYQVTPGSNPIWSRDIKLGGTDISMPTVGRVAYLWYSPPDTFAYPGIDGEKLKVTRPDNVEITKPNTPIFFKSEVPCSMNIDFTGFDPENPDQWVPVLDDPMDVRIISDNEKAELERKKAELEIDAKINATKLACIKKRLTEIKAGSVITQIDTVYAAKKDLNDEQQRQKELNIYNLQLIQPKVDAYETALAAAAEAVNGLTSYALSTDVSFIYAGTAPTPGATLSLPSVQNADIYDTECGIIESVSISFSSSSCSCSATARKYAE